ncbi:MAG: hypothetical protein QXD13_01560 [Candidatus Pacearchaeota archaeon]
MTENTEYGTESASSQELCSEADRILQEAGFNIFGRKKGSFDPKQVGFEIRMQTGAYSRNSERRRK